MARWVWKLYRTCRDCGHRNLPDRSYRKSIRMVLLGQFTQCRKCGGELSKSLKETPAVQEIRQELEEQGLLPIPTSAPVLATVAATPSP